MIAALRRFLRARPYAAPVRPVVPVVTVDESSIAQVAREAMAHPEQLLDCSDVTNDEMMQAFRERRPPLSANVIDLTLLASAPDRFAEYRFWKFIERRGQGRTWPRDPVTGRYLPASRGSES